MRPIREGRRGIPGNAGSSRSADFVFACITQIDQVALLEVLEDTA
jgi:hypothetical protein